MPAWGVVNWRSADGSLSVIKRDLGRESGGSDAGSDTTYALPSVRTMFLPLLVCWLT